MHVLAAAQRWVALDMDVKDNACVDDNDDDAWCRRSRFWEAWNAWRKEDKRFNTNDYCRPMISWLSAVQVCPEIFGKMNGMAKAMPSSVMNGVDVLKKLYR
jgi:hypothetical protein